MKTLLILTSVVGLFNFGLYYFNIQDIEQKEYVESAIQTESDIKITLNQEIQTDEDIFSKEIADIILDNLPVSSGTSINEINNTQIITEEKLNPVNIEYFNKIADWASNVGLAKSNSLDSQINFLLRLKKALSNKSNSTQVSPVESKSNISLLDTNLESSVFKPFTELSPLDTKFIEALSNQDLNSVTNTTETLIELGKIIG